MQDYNGFLKFLVDIYDIRPLRDHSKKIGGASICLLRHDVINDLEGAVLMAKAENDLGIKGTYFVFPSSKHFNADLITEIRGLGHEIGLHTDVLTRCLRSRRVGYAKRLFESELTILEKNNVTVHGVSSHDSEACDKYSVHNHDIFKEYHNLGKPERIKHTELFTISLKKYGLYEADLLYRDHVFSDSDGDWNFLHIRNAASVGHTVIQIIVHPLEWKF